ATATTKTTRPHRALPLMFKPPLRYRRSSTSPRRRTHQASYAVERRRRDTSPYLFLLRPHISRYPRSASSNPEPRRAVSRPRIGEMLLPLRPPPGRASGTEERGYKNGTDTRQLALVRLIQPGYL